MARYGIHLSKTGKPGGSAACGTNGNSCSCNYQKFMAEEERCKKCENSKLATFLSKQDVEKELKRIKETNPLFAKMLKKAGK